MNEKEFEDILCKYPGLIEDGLSLTGRQVNVKGKHVDLIFQDRYGQTLIIELKQGAVKREHIAQLLDYEGYFVSLDNPLVRVMLVGNRVPPNLKKALDHHGFEWKELPESTLITALQNEKDSQLLSYFDKFDKNPKAEEKRVATISNISKERSEIMTMIDKYIYLFSKPEHFEKEYSTHDIVKIIQKEFPETKKGTILPSDCCYNIFNFGGISFVKIKNGIPNIDMRSRLFEKSDLGYKFIGQNYPYTCELYWKGEICGIWKDGECKLHEWLIEAIITRS